MLTPIAAGIKISLLRLCWSRICSVWARWIDGVARNPAGALLDQVLSHLPSWGAGMADTCAFRRQELGEYFKR
jgi:hypothetical protein